MEMNTRLKRLGMKRGRAHLKRIFGLQRIFRLKDLLNALRASKIISIYTATRSFEHFSQRGLANIER